MKRAFLFTIVLFPLAALAQKTTVKTKPKSKAATVKTTAKVTPAVDTPKKTVFVVPAKPADGYVVYGTIAGVPDGTPVCFLNEQFGSLEELTRTANGKFAFTGKVNEPTMKRLYFGYSAQPFQLFLDNSSIEITGDIGMINQATVSGSPTHAEFSNLVNQIGPLQQALQNEGDVYDTATRNKMTSILVDYIQQHPTSYVTPIALVILQNTSAEKETLITSLYNSLGANIKFNPYSSYVAQQVESAKKIPLGTMLADFSQPDSTGKEVSLSSFRGKYILVDFWASWCRPCRQENPNVVAAYNKYSQKNFTILGVSFDQTKPAWINAIAVDGLKWSHISDLKGWGNSVGQQLGIQSIPQNLLVDPNGKVIGKNLRGKDLVRKLNEVLN